MKAAGLNSGQPAFSNGAFSSLFQTRCSVSVSYTHLIHYRPETAQQREENNNDIGHNHGGSSVQVGKGGDDQDNPRHLTGGPSQIIPHGH